MKKRLLLNVLFLGFSFLGSAQYDTALQNLQTKLNGTKSLSGKLDIISEISIKLVYKNPEECTNILNKGIFLAEESRDRELMIKAQRIAGYIYGQTASIKQNSEKALVYNSKALEMCKKVNGIEREKIACNIQMAVLQRFLENTGEAKKYNEAAIDLAEEIKDDSLIVNTKVSYGKTQLAAGEKLNAFKTFISAQTIAEKTKHANKEISEIMVYKNIAAFYASIEDYDKAIDYQYKALGLAKKETTPYEYLEILNSIGYNFIQDKKNDAATNIFKEIVRYGDSLHLEQYKTNGQIGLMNALASSPEPEKSLQFLKQNPDIATFINQLHLGYHLDYGLAQIYTATKQFDSAKFYFNKSIPVFEKTASVSSLPIIYYNYGHYFYVTNNFNNAIHYLKRAINITDSLKSNSGSKEFYALLDSCYQKSGDFKNAFIYNNLYQKAKLDEEEKGKAKDILAVEVDSENKRKERLELEEEENTRIRHNWQYMGIVVSIISLFVLLATLGIFNVPLKWVRALGFISFIFLFEFIILLADNWIHHFTHGEPWKVLAIKVVLIAMLLPLHHLLEHKAISYIAERRSRKLNGQDFSKGGDLEKSLVMNNH